MLQISGQRRSSPPERRQVNERTAKQKNLAADTRAVTALEYGIIASLLGLVLISVFGGLSTTLSMLFSHVGGAI
jgi:Flp pilus assembly pilin Flp